MTPEQRQKWLEGRTIHGGYSGGVEHPMHYIWRSMLARCNNPNCKSYKYYGGRGIKVSNRWMYYQNFLEDMKERPSKNHSLERIDTNKNYTLSNCRWATRSEQQKNKSTTKFYTNGKFKGTLVECAKYLGITKNTAYERWKNWNSFEKEIKWQLLKKV
jgi:hypothetical protein